jgi:hypothetical protein
MKTVKKKLVPYMKIWSHARADEILQFGQREILEHTKLVYSGRRYWKSQRFREICMADEFQRSLHRQKADIPKKVEEEADDALTWYAENEDSVVWNSVFEEEISNLKRANK